MTVIGFDFEDLVPIANAKVAGRTAANLLAAKLGHADGIVQCVRAAASLLDDIDQQHATHSDQVAMAARFRAG